MRRGCARRSLLPSPESRGSWFALYRRDLNHVYPLISRDRVKESCKIATPRLGVWALSVLACVALGSCGPNPRHLDEHLATQLLTRAIAYRQVTIVIAASDVVVGKDTSPRVGSRESSASEVAECNQAQETVRRLYVINGNGPLPLSYDALEALSRVGLLKRDRSGNVCPTYALTQAGKAASRTWEESKDGSDQYTATLGTGYDIGPVRNIRFSKHEGAYYATLDYDATPILNALGQALATAGDAELAKQTYTATMLLLNDGWGVLQDGM